MSATVPPVCLPPRLSTRLRAIRGGGGVVGGTGLVFWNSCSRRWARLECGNRLRTRTFMETCCWRRRRRPEGSQRLEQRRRRRRRRPDPCPHPGAGPHSLSAHPRTVARRGLQAGERSPGRVGQGRRSRGVGSRDGGGGCREMLPGPQLLARLRRGTPSALGSLQLWLRAGPRPPLRAEQG